MWLRAGTENTLFWGANVLHMGAGVTNLKPQPSLYSKLRYVYSTTLLNPITVGETA